MRRFILIAAMLLTSASARADGPRGLSLASNDDVVAAGQLQATEAPQARLPNAEASKVVDQPGDAAPQPPKADQANSNPIKSGQTKPASGKSERQKFTRSPLEASVVDELHRHGIYW